MGKFSLGVAAVSLAAILMPAVGGCSHNDAKKSGGAITSAQDDCPHCAGIQKATADGKCPECGMQVVNK